MTSALLAAAVAAISFVVGVSFRAGMIWEGIGEHEERLKRLERRHHDLDRRVLTLTNSLTRDDLASEELSDALASEGLAIDEGFEHDEDG